MLSSNKSLTVPIDDPFHSLVVAYDARSVMQGRPLLRFSKGFWIAGTDGPELPRGTELTALMNSAAHGYTKWKNQRPVEYRIGLIATGFVPESRDDLGDLDETKWSKDQQGNPRDPWVYGFYLPLEGMSETYIFATSSWGGKKAMRNLCDAYTHREKPELLPRVVLDVHQRPHKEYGMIPEPMLDVVGWVIAKPDSPQS
jgi:hypothetical protein